MKTIEFKNAQELVAIIEQVQKNPDAPVKAVQGDFSITFDVATLPEALPIPPHATKYELTKAALWEALPRETRLRANLSKLKKEIRQRPGKWENIS